MCKFAGPGLVQVSKEQREELTQGAGTHHQVIQEAWVECRYWGRRRLHGRQRQVQGFQVIRDAGKVLKKYDVHVSSRNARNGANFHINTIRTWRHRTGWNPEKEELFWYAGGPA